MTDGGRDTVAAAVAAAFPGRTVAERVDVSRGNTKRTAVVRFVGGDGPRSVVIQTAADGDALRTEAAVGRSIRARTDVPVPAVLDGGALGSDGHGYLVTEHVAGDDLHGAFVGLSPERRLGVARTFGSALAQVHGSFAFEAFGEVGVRVDDDGSRDAADRRTPRGDAGEWHAVLDPADPGSSLRVRRPGFGRATEDGPSDRSPESGSAGVERWNEWFRGYALAGIDALPSAFDAVRPRLREAVADAAGSLPDAPRPRLYPWDLRPGNALVADGRVAAVLDWGRPLAADPGLSVAKAEHLVCDWYVDDGDPLREAFRAGYREVRPPPRVPDVYRAVAVVRSAVDGAGVVTRPRYPEVDGAEAVAFHLDRIRTALDG
ncbi:phosphotransferase family protein [Halobaculum sp. EA56]|uniref:phosphotransferase family protein n=1 Tax=Halobaculum sp. EA56 TaxID=3421648 RepID=UPI003EB7DE65